MQLAKWRLFEIFPANFNGSRILLYVQFSKFTRYLYRWVCAVQFIIFSNLLTIESCTSNKLHYSILSTKWIRQSFDSWFFSCACFKILFPIFYFHWVIKATLPIVEFLSIVGKTARLIGFSCQFSSIPICTLKKISEYYFVFILFAIRIFEEYIKFYCDYDSKFNILTDESIKWLRFGKISIVSS